MGMNARAALAWGVVVNEYKLPEEFQKFLDPDLLEEEGFMEAVDNAGDFPEFVGIEQSGYYDSEIYVIHFDPLLVWGDWNDPTPIPEHSARKMFPKQMEFKEWLKSVGLTDEPQYWLVAYYG
jgi:hypothetical protein